MITFSIITAVKNGAAGLQKTIDGVVSQSYPDREHIIIDGGSTDGTLDIIRANAGRIAFWSSGPDAGISQAFNKGIDHAAGDLLLFLNCGDEFAAPDVLARAAQAASAHASPARMVFYGDADFVYPRHVLRQCADHTILPYANSIYHQATFVGREVHAALRYDERLRINMDYDMWLRASGMYEFVKLDFPVCRYLAGGISFSKKIAAHKVIEHEVVKRLNTGRKMDERMLVSLIFRIIRYKAIKWFQGLPFGSLAAIYRKKPGK
jgi:glycosyltransferase involved in cell wall biosynthesis